MLEQIFRPLAIAGNLMFVLWILRNGINEGFSGTVIEKVSYVALILLLILNALLLYRFRGAGRKGSA